MDNPSTLGSLFWQFQLNGFPLLPRLASWGKIEQLEGEFWLKVWGERLLFCAASAPERVFAVTTPCLQTQNLVSFWRAALKERQFGRLTMATQFLTQAEETDSAFFTIQQSDGSRWRCEWCGGEWSKIRSVQASRVPVWHPEWSASRSSIAPDEYLREVLARPFPESERLNQPLLWLNGSRSELKKVVQACVTLSLFHVTHTRRNGSTDDVNHFYYFTHTPFFESSMHGSGNFSHWHIPHPWKMVLSRYFIAVGWQWTPRKNKNEQLREGWKVAPRMQSMTIDVSSAFSPQEKLEAQLFLRDWLLWRVRLSEEQVAELLT